MTKQANQATQRRVVRLASVTFLSGGILAFALTGCAAAGKPGIVHDFTSGGETSPSISFELPSGLSELALKDAEVVAVPVYAEGVRIESDSLCALDMRYDYGDGFLDSVDEIRYIRLTNLEREHREELEQLGDYFESIWNTRSFDEAQRRIDSGEGRILSLPITELLDAQERLDALKEEEARRVKEYEEERTKVLETPVHYYLENRISNDSWKTFDRAEFNDDKPAHGLYFSEDLAQIRAVFDCALDFISDTGWPVRVITRGADGSETTIATSTIAAMKNGDILITQTEIFGYAPDSNGDWVTL